MYRPSFIYFLFYMGPIQETECCAKEQWKIDQINDLISSSIANVDSIWTLVLQLGKKLWIYRPSAQWSQNCEKLLEREWLNNVAYRIDSNNVDLREIREELAYIVESL